MKLLITCKHIMMSVWFILIIMLMIIGTNRALVVAMCASIAIAFVIWNMNRLIEEEQ